MALSAWQTWPWQSSICVMAINFISIRFKLFSCLVLTIFSASYTNAGGGGGFWFRLSAWKCSSVVALFFFQVQFKWKNAQKTTSKVSGEVRSSAATHQSNEWNYEWAGKLTDYTSRVSSRSAWMTMPISWISIYSRLRSEGHQTYIGLPRH